MVIMVLTVAPFPEKYPLAIKHSHGKSSFLIGEPSISMGHLYHGYVKNQMVNGHYIALPCYSPRYYQIYQTPKRGAEMRIANRHPPGSEGRCPPHG